MKSMNKTIFLGSFMTIAITLTALFNAGWVLYCAISFVIGFLYRDKNNSAD